MAQVTTYPTKCQSNTRIPLVKSSLNSKLDKIEIDSASSAIQPGFSCLCIQYGKLTFHKYINMYHTYLCITLIIHTFVSYITVYYETGR